MVKTAAKVKTTYSEKSAKQYMGSLDIKQLFLSEAFNLGWRLVATFLVPVVLGVVLDKHYDSKPLYSLIGVGLAIVASIVTIQRTVKDVNKDIKSASNKESK